jgi:hypothetical protein
MYAAYIFDYGAPIFFRHVLQRPQGVTAIIAQNGNGYRQGLGEDFWAPLEQYWDSVTQKLVNQQTRQIQSGSSSVQLS